MPGPRLFEDQAAIFGPEMVNDWSGAIIYEWIEEQNNYGLISYGPKADPKVTGDNVVDGFTRAGMPTPVSPDFENLSKQWAKITPTGVAKSNYNPKIVSTRACPTSTADGWLLDGNVAAPTLGASLGTGSYTSAPTVAATDAAPSHEVTGIAAGLVGVIMAYTFWL
jgi:hypothetical protein